MNVVCSSDDSSSSCEDLQAKFDTLSEIEEPTEKESKQMMTVWAKLIKKGCVENFDI